MPATQTAATARFLFAAGTLVTVLAPYQILPGLGADAWSGRTMVVVEHRADFNSEDDVLLVDESGDPRTEVYIWAGRLIAD